MIFVDLNSCSVETGGFEARLDVPNSWFLQNMSLELARRLETVQAERGAQYVYAQQRLEPDGNSGVLSVAGGRVLYAGACLPVHRATGLGMNGPVTQNDLAAVEAFYRDHGLPSRIDLCPLADPTLLDLLQQAHYRIDTFYSVLFCPLPIEAVAAGVTTDLQVSLAKPEESDLWIRTTAQGFTEMEAPLSPTCAF